MYKRILDSDLRKRFKKNPELLREVLESKPDCRQIIVSLDKMTRHSGDIDLMYVTDFFKALWKGEII